VNNLDRAILNHRDNTSIKECWVCEGSGTMNHDNDEDGQMTCMAEGYVHWDCYDEAVKLQEEVKERSK